MTLVRNPALADHRTQRLLEALAKGGGQTRFVGGAVRDAILGRPIADIDLATTLLPDETMLTLKKAGLIAKPTGIKHGTVTAIVDGRPFEITTLRRDVTTDGRQATVEFTDDWRADAARRDFTINAMSADIDGNIYDYFGGEDDLKAGIVRFVGEAGERVREDYLRILRFFRFHAWYGHSDPDPDSIRAIAAGIDGLVHVSAERIRTEFFRLLSAPSITNTLEAMSLSGVLEVLLGEPPKNIAAIETLPQDPVLRLAALVPGSSDIGDRLRLSNSERANLLALAPPWTTLGLQTAEWQKAIYGIGIEVFVQRAHLEALDGRASLLEARLELAQSWKTPVFPVKGSDLIKLGLTPGPAVTLLLNKLENRWIDAGFSTNREALLASAKEEIDGGGGDGY
ncbi:MAG: CCA tRNA nucleotidyltransferase [Rhodospirillales bacterium]